VVVRYPEAGLIFFGWLVVTDLPYLALRPR
jgi:hypothetical protein